MRHVSKTTLMSVLTACGLFCFSYPAWSQESEPTDAPEVASKNEQIVFKDYEITYEEMASRYLKRELKNPPQYFEINWAQLDPEGLQEAQRDEFLYQEKQKEKIAEYLENQKVLGMKIRFAITGKFLSYDFKKKAFLVDDFFDFSGAYRVGSISVPISTVWKVKGKNELPRSFNLQPVKGFTHISMSEANAKALTAEMAQSNRDVVGIFEAELAHTDKKMLKDLGILTWFVKVHSLKLYRWAGDGYRFVGEVK